MVNLSDIVSAAGRLSAATRDHRLLTLIYHRVHAGPDPMFPGEVDVAVLNWQMNLLRRHCTPLALTDAVERLGAGTLPARAVAVTFDDGYADNFQLALPVLRRFDIPATFFVSAGYLDGGRMWNDSIVESIRRATVSHIDLESIGLGRIAIGAMQQRHATANRLIDALKRYPPDERDRRVRLVCDLIGARLPDDLMLSSAQLQSAAAQGVEIGAHTMSHAILSVLSDSDAEREIQQSRSVLESISGKKVVAFAYPNGRPGEDFGPRDRRLVGALGFKYAVTTANGVATSATDPFELPRFTPWARSPARWLARLLLAYRQTA